MSASYRQDKALAVFEAAGIELQNIRPDAGPRRWFVAGLPTMKGLNELELVAAYIDEALRLAVLRLVSLPDSRQDQDSGVSE